MDRFEKEGGAYQQFSEVSRPAHRAFLGNRMAQEDATLFVRLANSAQDYYHGTWPIMVDIVGQLESLTRDVRQLSAKYQNQDDSPAE